jgi:hypothetical protein
MDAELSQLKTLSLETYALSHGYVRDSKKSSRKFTVLRRESDNDKLLLRTDVDGHSVYRSERNPADRGTILDFVMSRLGVGLGEARKELRQWSSLSFHSGQTSVRTSEPSVLEQPDKPELDHQRILSGWNKSTWNTEPAYLLQRNIPCSVLNDPRFMDCWRVSSQGAVLFPHRDQSGLCGLEIRGDQLKVFSKGGRKGLWLSANIKTCLRLVITESPIDCLSFHALHSDATDALWPFGYVSFGGGLGNRQKLLLAALMRRVHDRGAEVIIGTDNDLAGDGYAETLSALSPVALERILPIGKDWNADLVWCAKENGSWN